MLFLMLFLRQFGSWPDTELGVDIFLEPPEGQELFVTKFDLGMHVSESWSTAFVADMQSTAIPELFQSRATLETFNSPKFIFISVSGCQCVFIFGRALMAALLRHLKALCTV